MSRRWTQFDPAYQQALLTFKETGTFKIGPFPLKAARAARSKFYAFRQAVYAGVKSDADYHPVLLDLIDTLTKVMVSIEPTGDLDGLYMLELCQDPWTAASPPSSKPEEAAADDCGISDIPEAGEDFFRKAKLVLPGNRR